MTRERWTFLMDEEKSGSVGVILTDEEIAQGWHFCYDFDGLLRNNREEDYQCQCFETIFNV